MPSSGPSARIVLARGLAARCPACGEGSVFVRRVESARVCPVCGWRLERCHGHWIGGNEINVLATFPVGIAAFALAAVPFGLGPISVAIAVAATAAFSVAFYRSSRGLFFALDYLIDPVADLSSMPPGSLPDERDPRHTPRTDCPPPSGPHRPRPGLGAPLPVPPESLVAAPPAPCRPPATASP